MYSKRVSERSARHGVRQRFDKSHFGRGGTLDTVLTNVFLQCLSDLVWRSVGNPVFPHTVEATKVLFMEVPRYFLEDFVLDGITTVFLPQELPL